MVLLETVLFGVLVFCFVVILMVVLVELVAGGVIVHLCYREGPTKLRTSHYYVCLLPLSVCLEAILVVMVVMVCWLW